MNTYYCRPYGEPRDEEIEVKAYDTEHAALEYAEQNDANNADYPDEQTVIVRNGEAETRFTVTSEVVRKYYASEI